MMNCQKVRRELGQYQDLEPTHPLRIEIEAHLFTCKSCQQEAHYWEESNRILQAIPSQNEVFDYDALRFNVMERIYQEQQFLRPVIETTYHFSRSIRKRIYYFFSGLLTIFLTSLFFFFMSYFKNELEPTDGLVFNISEVPTASIGDPILLKMIPTYPPYWIGFSLFGVTFMFLILHWANHLKR